MITSVLIAIGLGVGLSLICWAALALDDWHARRTWRAAGRQAAEALKLRTPQRHTDNKTPEKPQ